jgi:glycosyltransferase involved in cell wall biosynthesis
MIPDEELAPMFAGAAAVVMPYREIDASGVLTMAIQSGRVIVASNIGNFAELLDDGHSALLVSPDDPDGLASAMARVVTDSGLRGTLADGVRHLRAQIPTWPAIGAMTAAVYRRLTATQPASTIRPERSAASAR